MNKQLYTKLPYFKYFPELMRGDLEKGGMAQIQTDKEAILMVKILTRTELPLF